VIAEILTIGDELLRGEIVDSNKSLLSERLLSLDIETHFHASVRDEPADMRDAFLRAASRADVVLVSGGLGPTRDDLTTEVLAQSFGRALVRDPSALAEIRAFFARVGREMAPNNAKQADFPEGAEILPNPVGTAPGFCLRVPRAGQGGEVWFCCMPGVPRELTRMLDEQVLPRLAARQASAGSGAGGVMRAALLRTFGIGESNLDAELADLAREPGVVLGFRTSFPENVLRPLVRAKSAEEAERRLAQLSAQIRERLGPVVYGAGEDGLPAVVGRLLREHKRTLALAESCTGGLIAQLVTDVAGSSDYFLGGAVVYANSAKRDLLGVPAELIEKHGAVSEPVARALAEGARARFGADYGVATTGISGPGGGSEEKPVGTVFLALASAERTHVDRFVFPLDRARHRAITAWTALDWVRRDLIGAPIVGPTLMRQLRAPGGR
jgi:nicotinamide-nucleotide amidase